LFRANGRRLRLTPRALHFSFKCAGAGCPSSSTRSRAAMSSSTSSLWAQVEGDRPVDLLQAQRRRVRPNRFRCLTVPELPNDAVKGHTTPHEGETSRRSTNCRSMRARPSFSSAHPDGSGRRSTRTPAVAHPPLRSPAPVRAPRARPCLRRTIGRRASRRAARAVAERISATGSSGRAPSRCAPRRR